MFDIQEISAHIGRVTGHGIAGYLRRYYSRWLMPPILILFGLGIIGTGLLAIPVLAGSAAYAISEGLRWRTGLDRQPGEAAGFYAVLATATLFGLGLTFTSLDPIRALFWSAVINGVVAVPVMVVMMCMAANPRVMGSCGCRVVCHLGQVVGHPI